MLFTKSLSLTLLIILESAVCFTASPALLRPTIITKTSKSNNNGHMTPLPNAQASSARSPISVVSMMVEEDDDGSSSNAVRVEPGTHDELMYALGVNLARQLGDIRPLVQDGEELAQVAKGLLDTVVGRLDDNGQRMLLSSRGKELDELIVSRANALREQLEKRGREMLQNMAETEGVKVLDSGVILHVLEDGPGGPGQGIRATKASVVQIHYHGTLADGTVFDSTLGGDPVNFPLAQVIPGWREGVLAMHEGETAMLGIPPEQGYGPQGTPDGRIPGGSALFFKIQLLKVLTGEIGGSGLVGPDGKSPLKRNDGGSGLIL